MFLHHKGEKRECARIIFPMKLYCKNMRAHSRFSLLWCKNTAIPSTYILNWLMCAIFLELTDIVIGFTNASYVTSENDGFAKISFGVISGTSQQGVIATLNLSLASASASGETCKCIIRVTIGLLLQLMIFLVWKVLTF